MVLDEDTRLNSVQAYTPSEVWRTANAYIVGTDRELGAGLTHGINQVCQCCKAGSVTEGKVQGWVDRIMDAVDLKPWRDFYKTKDYAAYKCRSCGYQWSWYRNFV